jgi:hypothetical protein
VFTEILNAMSDNYLILRQCNIMNVQILTLNISLKGHKVLIYHDCGHILPSGIRTDFTPSKETAYCLGCELPEVSSLSPLPDLILSDLICPSEISIMMLVFINHTHTHTHTHTHCFECHGSNSV